MTTSAGQIVLLTGTSNPKLAEEVGKLLNTEVYNPITKFADGEIRVKVNKNMRRNEVFIIHPTAPPVNEHLMELFLMIDAAKRASAAEITVVIPYFGYARQDRKEQPRVPISSSLIVKIIETSGANRIVTVDIHSDQQQGFFFGPWDNLYGSYSLIPVIEKKQIQDLVVASPDKNGVSRAVAFAKRLDAEGVAIVFKERDLDVNNKSETLGIIGEVKDKNVLIIDDMIDTAGTLVNAANLIMEKGAKSVRAVATHGLFSADAVEKINQSPIEEVFTTDTISVQPEIVNNPKFTVASVAELLAEAIRCIRSGESISERLMT